MRLEDPRDPVTRWLGDERRKAAQRQGNEWEKPKSGKGSWRSVEEGRQRSNGESEGSERDRPLWPCLLPEDAQDTGGEGTAHPGPEWEGLTLGRALSPQVDRSQTGPDCSWFQTPPLSLWSPAPASAIPGMPRGGDLMGPGCQGPRLR